MDEITSDMTICLSVGEGWTVLPFLQDVVKGTSGRNESRMSGGGGNRYAEISQSPPAGMFLPLKSGLPATHYPLEPELLIHSIIWILRVILMRGWRTDLQTQGQKEGQ